MQVGQVQNQQNVNFQQVPSYGNVAVKVGPMSWSGFRPIKDGFDKKPEAAPAAPKDEPKKPMTFWQKAAVYSSRVFGGLSVAGGVASLGWGTYTAINASYMAGTMALAPIIPWAVGGVAAAAVGLGLFKLASWLKDKFTKVEKPAQQPAPATV